MKRPQTIGVILFAGSMLMNSACSSREHVESMNLMNEGVVFAQQGRTVDAADRLQRATGMDPNNDEAFFNLCIVHMQDHKFEAARDDIQKAIAIKADSAGYEDKLGTILIELKNWDAAKQAFAKAIEKDPALFKSYYKLGRVHEQLAQNEDGNENLQQALKRYTEAVEKGPRFLEAYSALGRLYADLGYLDQAAQVLKGAEEVALAGTDEAALVHHLLGTVYQQQQKNDDAVREFRAALEINPGMADALFSLGWTYATMGNREEATRFLRKYVDAAGANAPQHYLKAARDRLADLTTVH